MARGPELCSGFHVPRPDRIPVGKRKKNRVRFREGNLTRRLVALVRGPHAGTGMDIPHLDIAVNRRNDQPGDAVDVGSGR